MLFIAVQPVFNAHLDIVCNIFVEEIVHKNKGFLMYIGNLVVSYILGEIKVILKAHNINSIDTIVVVVVVVLL